MQANRLVLATLAVGILGGVGATAGGGAVPAGGKPTEPAAGARIDLATYAAKRWVVQLDGQPLATYTGGVAGFPATMATATGASALNASSARSRAYVAHLQAVQRAFAGRLQSVVPGARVQRRYQVVLNGLGVRMSKAQAARVRRMAGVRAVTPDVPYHLDRYATPEQIGAPTLWNMLGGQSKAGNGVRVAVIDSGIFVRRVNGKYAGNRCFDDTGYSAPGGYPKGDTRFTNRKVIVARAYFRPSDPPVAGENTPIQGTNAADPHGTHTAGTIACDAGTQVDFQGASVTLSGIAPRAFLMNYRVFYPSESEDVFQNGNAYTVELVKAIDDAVKDGAQVISNSWGASYQNTLAWPDPMIKAAERATAAGVTMVFANGNAGPDEATANSPAISPKVIAVGAVSAANAGDVVADFSSRGPSQDGLIKPDVVAPGVDVLSSGYGIGDFPEPFTGFGSASGTSMATPHVAGAAALLKQLHPGWKPAQIKSALMTTATEDVVLDTAPSIPAGVLDRGAGRIDLTKAGTPGLIVDQPSLSAGDLQQNQSMEFTVKATDTTTQAKTWTVEAVQTSEDTDSYSITPSLESIRLPANGSASFKVTVAASPGAEPGEYEGEVVLVNTTSGKQAHIPVWLRVLPPDPTADVLLVDDDGSSVDDSFADHSSRYTSLLDSLGVDYRYVDAGSDGFPGLFDLYGYRLVILFTGDNDSFDTSGLSPTDQDNLTEWLDSGGRLWVTGQNVAEETDSNDIDSQSLGRARLYQGYLGLSEVADSAYDGSAPSPTVEGAGPMMTAPTQDDPDPEPFEVDLGPGGSGAANQGSIEVATPMADNDTYAAAKTMTPLFRPLDSDYSDDGALAVSWGRSSEPRLEEERQEFRYRAVWMGFGMEAVNGNTGFTRPKTVAANTMDWLLDTITFGDPENDVAPVEVTTRGKSGKHLTFVVNPFSSANAKWVRIRWDFGDKTKILTVDKDHPKETGNLYAPRIADHTYGRGGTYKMRVEATDTLGHSAIAKVTVKVR